MPRSFLNPIPFQALPVEILCHILETMELHDLLACSMVSKHLRRVIDQSSKLQYSVELQKARMVSLLPSSSSPAFASRLKLLREREGNWKYMDWVQRATLSLPPTGSVYEFVGGLYGNGREDDGRVTGSISFLELPSSDSYFLGEPQNELKSWTHSMGGVNIIDFTMDPSQDLLVLVALAAPESKYVYELHLRSIETNQPHRRAPLHILPCWLKTPTTVQSSDLVAAVRIQVSGSLVALLIKEIHEGTGAHLEIWNWETHPRYSCALTRNSGIDDFTFLTNDAFLLVRPAGRFEVYTFTDPSTCKCPTSPVLRVMYSFPRLSPGYMYWYISMSSNPAPGYVPRPRSDTKHQYPELGNKNQLYYPRPEERIHACCLYIFNPASEENAQVYSFVFFLNLQTLLNPPTEWVESVQSTATNSKASKRQPEVATRPGTSVNTHYASSSSSSTSASSPVDPPSNLQPGSESHDNFPPFIPSYPEQESIRQSPQYPLFPTFDEHRTSPIPRPRMGSDRFGEVKSRQPAHRRRLRQTTSPLASIPPNTEIPWDVWGPQSTRWFEECLSTDWQHAIYGLRTVESVDPSQGPNLPAIVNTNPSPSPETASDLGSIENQPDGAMALGLSSSAATADLPVGVTLPHNSQTSAINGTEGTQNQGDDNLEDADGSSDGDAQENGPAHPSQARRYLRVRDFNPYSFTLDNRALMSARTKAKKRGEALWREPRLVTEASTTPVKGVFTKDIVSSLPYMEIISKDKFEVTDVMMDDCRLLLLKRGQAGKLKRVEVLMM